MYANIFLQIISGRAYASHRNYYVECKNFATVLIMSGFLEYKMDTLTRGILRAK